MFTELSICEFPFLTGGCVGRGEIVYANVWMGCPGRTLWTVLGTPVLYAFVSYRRLSPQFKFCWNHLKEGSSASYKFFCVDSESFFLFSVIGCHNTSTVNWFDCLYLSIHPLKLSNGGVKEPVLMLIFFFIVIIRIMDAPFIYVYSIVSFIKKCRSAH